jgi:hypothetical protein
MELRNMGINSWGTAGLDRTEWTSVVRETKAKLEGFSEEEEEEEEEEEDDDDDDDVQGGGFHRLCNAAV